MKRFITLLFVVFTILDTNLFATEPTLLIKIPTRSRPSQFLKILDLYYQKLSGSVPYSFLISCDNDDPTMNNETMKSILATYPNLTLLFDNNTSKIEAYNNGLGTADFDIVLITSDDMEPVMQGYDKIIVDTMLKYFPDYDGVLNFNDGKLISQCNTLPVIGKKFFNRFGYAYHPTYLSLWCDVELTLISRMLRKEKTFDTVLIRHRHPANGEGMNDELYIHNATFEPIDGKIFRQRLHNFFDIHPLDIEKICSKDWSILICATSNDTIWLRLITKNLENSISKAGLQDKIEIIVDNSDIERGHKRNELCRDCNGKYFNFIDPGTIINDDYVQVIYDKILENPDVVIPDNKFPLYLCPIKRIIGLSFVFIERESNSESVWEDFIRKGNLIQNIEYTDHKIISLAPE